MNIVKRISTKLNISEHQVKATLALIDEGATIPFIARYRKEVTGNLSDTELRELDELLTYLRRLAERLATVLKSIEEQGQLTDELKRALVNVETLSELEDLYRPYRPKRKTRASIAISKGLKPLADYFIAGQKRLDHDTFVASFINSEKGVDDENSALSGAYDIIAEVLSDEAKYRQAIKKLINRQAFIVSKELMKDEKDTYGQYADYKEKIDKIPPHRILALYRGEKVKCLKLSLDYDFDEVKALISKDYTRNDFKTIFSDIIDDSLKRLILPSVENEIRNDLFVRAEDASLVVFKKNLASLLLYPPLKNKTILGFDPGFRTGAKYAVVNALGIMQEVGIVFLVAGSAYQKAQAVTQITRLLKTYHIDYIALGNGTASRESEVALRAIIKANNFSTKLFIVNESGASVYSASKLAETEFPKLLVEERSAISIARRLQDPLSELVKIDPKAIGVGQYQHDMNQTRLGEVLYGVVEDAVNTVGVDVNIASPALLNYVAGLSKQVATNINEHIKLNGPFKTREQLQKVKGLGPKSFEQCAGFLRIYDGTDELDTSAIHPESYAVARFIIKEADIDLLNDDVNQKENALKSIDKQSILSKFNLGSATYEDIIEEIKRPGRDIREDVEIVELNNEVNDIKDLKPGMILNGTVRNIMDFGMFVDINVGQDGLVHISEVATTFVQDISAHYSINDIVKVKVLSVDTAKKRISLSIKQL